MNTNLPILRATGLSKYYGGVVALEDTAIELRPGTIVALIGENGAGKSTLVKILSGAIQPDSGHIWIDERPVRYKTIKEAQDLGIRVVHQIPTLAPDLSILDNIFLGNEKIVKGRLGWLKRVDFQCQSDTLKPYLDHFAPHLKPNTRLSALKANELRLLGIIKALLHSARVLILDEPTAALPASERIILMESIRNLREQGLSILYVSHHLEEIEQLADEMVALRDGRLVGHEFGTPDVGHMVELMVGEKVENISELYGHSQTLTHRGDADEDFALTVYPPSGAERQGTFIEDSVHLQVAAGEVVVLTGLVSSGIQDVAEAAFGARRDWSATLCIGGKAHQIADPSSAIALGVGYLPDDRSAKAVIADLSVKLNSSIAALEKITGSFGRLDQKREKKEIKSLNDALKVRRLNDEQKITELSGGNQQKVMLGRWLFANSRFVILNEPTQGIDVMAKVEIMTLLSKFIGSGGGILVVTTEADEFLALASKVVIMRQGKITSEFCAPEINSKKVTEAVFVDSPKG
jgi:ribose transport system ATP-binding protein